MKSFKEYITESVPNRSHGRVYRQFYEMGKKGNHPFAPENEGELSSKQRLLALFTGMPHEAFPKSELEYKNENNPDEHIMRFPSFRQDSLGRDLSSEVITYARPAGPRPRRGWSHRPDIYDKVHEPTTHMTSIDLNKHHSESDIINTLGHEAMHSIQNERDTAGSGYFARRWGGSDPIYRDAIGNLRSYNHANYQNFGGYRTDPNVLERLVSSFVQKNTRRPFAKERARMAYDANDREHDARLGGEIARVGYEMGKQHYHGGPYGFPAYSTFRAYVDPKSDRQERRTRSAYGRMATEHQRLTRTTINP